MEKFERYISSKWKTKIDNNIEIINEKILKGMSFYSISNQDWKDTYLPQILKIRNTAVKRRDFEQLNHFLSKLIDDLYRSANYEDLNKLLISFKKEYVSNCNQ